MASSADWVKGYARQAEADFEAYRELWGSGWLRQCHKLQFLQMACEKLVKAYLIKGGAEPITLQSSHAYIARTLPIVIRQQMAFSTTRTHNPAWIIKHSQIISGEIEMLAPAVKRGGSRTDNCEYPWEDASATVRVPFDWKFKPSELLLAKAARTFLKLVNDAILRLQT